ncbi:uncharacterized protein LOC106011887 [Aplysia californica]|uniref:Uncharacterized protein LOC106011887 n=1 Tax=Aplysia californica TaxID=6500 RepID=A0ABM1A0T1_APLCA|nr:uncharacterized protein LOC106011887 [Aplysia californica]
MAAAHRFLLTVTLATVLFSHVQGHGRLIDPPARSTMWRYGFNTPVNYDDNALYCGGFDVRSWDSKVHHVDVQLPRGLTCTQCVLQWKYNAGNSWGCRGQNDCCVGCGHQEQFYGCADISISGTWSSSHGGDTYAQSAQHGVSGSVALRDSLEQSERLLRG